MFSSIRRFFTPTKPTKPTFKVYISGLDGAGKTTILYKLVLDEIVTTCPTIGYNNEMLELSHAELLMLDVGGDGGRGNRRHWRHAMDGWMDVKGFVFVVDASDRSRLEDAAEYLHWGLTGDTDRGNPRRPLLIFANGRHVRSTEKPMSVEELREGLRLSNVVDREVYIQECDVLDERALSQLRHGLEWIVGRMVLYVRIRTIPRAEQIYVRLGSLNGDVSEEIVINSLTSVELLKERIAQVTGVSRQRQHLVADTIVLNDSDLVARHCQQGTRTVSVMLIVCGEKENDAARIDEKSMRHGQKPLALESEGSDDPRTSVFS